MRTHGASRSERAAEGRDEEEHRHRPQRRTASEPVARLPGEEHAEERADKRNGNDESVPECRKPELGLDRLLRAGYHAGVESEQKTADRRGDGDVKKKSIHADIIPKGAQPQGNDMSTSRFV